LWRCGRRRKKIRAREASPDKKPGPRGPGSVKKKKKSKKLVLFEDYLLLFEHFSMFFSCEHGHDMTGREILTDPLKITVI
jgi:hypothetical protein